MVGLQLILPLLLWMAWLHSSAAGAAPLVDPLVGTGIYLGSLLLIILAVRQLARMAMRHRPGAASAGVGRLHQTVFIARLLILALHAVALFSLGYGLLVYTITPPFARSIETVSAIISFVPVVAAWMGLIWAQHPLDRAVREQNAIYAFEFGDPVYPIPSFGQQILGAFRLQILFTLLPILLIGLVHDVGFAVLQRFSSDKSANVVDLLTAIFAAAAVYLLSPELLRRVLPTQPLPPSELRSNLEAMCQRMNLGYREILLWRTHHTLDNAAVMGLLPQVRYILLSDLLISTMTQQQIEAVFAHEAGHVKHRHMAWYLVFFLSLTLILYALAEWLAHRPWMTQKISLNDLVTAMSLLGVLMMFALFGMLSRNMERQADVFAARTMTASPAGASPDGPSVGRDGVAVFCSALAKVARVNNMPLDPTAAAFGKPLVLRVWARVVSHSANWLHGSIRSRLDYLQTLIDAPDRLAAFDRKMLLIRLLLLTSLGVAIAWTAMTINTPVGPM